MARLFIVDDDPDARRLIGLVLRRAGHEPLYAEDGFQAMGARDREQPDLVILDWMLPGMDGSEVLEAMRQRASWKDLPVIHADGQGADHPGGGAEAYERPRLPDQAGLRGNPGADRAGGLGSRSSVPVP